MTAVPFALFSMSLGYAGLSAAWFQAALVYGVPTVISDALLVIGLCLFGGLVFVQMRRYGDAPTAIADEFRDPISASFFATFSMSLLALGGALLVHSTTVATILWSLGAATQLVLAVAIIARWFERDCDVTFVNPGWFLPSAGNLLAPITGQKLGFEELSWFFFSVGVVFWVILFVILIYRVIFLGPFPKRLNPTLFIFLAPPSLAFLSLEGLVGDATQPVSKILLYITVFFAVLLIALHKRFVETPFSPVWWSCTFPTAAFATAAIRYAAGTDTYASHSLAICALTITTFLVGIISVLTAKSALSGRFLAVT